MARSCLLLDEITRRPESIGVELGGDFVVPGLLRAQDSLVKQVRLNITRILPNVAMTALNRHGHRWNESAICLALATLHIDRLNECFNAISNLSGRPAEGFDLVCSAPVREDHERLDVLEVVGVGKLGQRHSNIVRAAYRHSLLRLPLRHLQVPQFSCKEALRRVQIVQIRVDRPLSTVAGCAEDVFRHINEANVSTLPIKRSKLETEAGDGVVRRRMIWLLYV